MIVRALDSNHDWSFGKGKNDYKRDNDAITQNINTRLNSFLGDCFFAVTEGIDWFNLLGSKEVLALNLAIGARILNTNGVVGIQQISLDIDEERAFTVRYIAQTIYSSANGEFTLDLNGSV